MTCAHADAIEELAMGFVSGAEAARLEAHRAICAECAATYAAFAADRALFVRRAAAMPLPNLESSILAAATEATSRRWRALARASRGIAAAAACAAAITAVTRLEAPRYLEAPKGAEEIATASLELEGDSLACAFPASGIVSFTDSFESRATMSFTRDPLVCKGGERVTASLARP